MKQKKIKTYQFGLTKSELLQIFKQYNFHKMINSVTDKRTKKWINSKLKKLWKSDEPFCEI